MVEFEKNVINFKYAMSKIWLENAMTSHLSKIWRENVPIYCTLFKFNSNYLRALPNAQVHDLSTCYW